MLLYRADKRIFNIGEVIQSANEFTTKNPPGSNAIEQLFDTMRPEGKPNRFGCLFLFDDLVHAKKHWSKMTDGKLYVVEICANSILHRGDMQLIDRAYRSGDDGQRQRCAREYWGGTETQGSVIETLVEKATVVDVVSKDQEERKAYLNSWMLGSVG